MPYDPKNRATWRAIFYVILIYGTVYFLLRLTALLPEYENRQHNPAATFFLPLYLLEDNLQPLLPGKL